MTSISKLKKLKNSYQVGSALKNKVKGIKKLTFYTASQRKTIKKIDWHD